MAVDREGLREALGEEPPHSPPPPPIPERLRFFLTKCPHCGWVGSSEQCPTEPNDDGSDVWCPVCHSPGCEADPTLAEFAEHGEAVYQRIAAAQADVARLSAVVEALRKEVARQNREIAEDADHWEGVMARLERAETALKPFAEYARLSEEAGLDIGDGEIGEFIHRGFRRSIRSQDLRAARAALSRADKADSRERGDA